MGSTYGIMFQVFINEVEYNHFCRITKVKFQLKACWIQVILRFSVTLFLPFFFFWYIGTGNFKCKWGERLWWFIDVFICQFPRIKNRAALLAFNSIDIVVVKCRSLESLAATTASNWNLRSLENILYLLANYWWFICTANSKGILWGWVSQANSHMGCAAYKRLLQEQWKFKQTRYRWFSNFYSNPEVWPITGYLLAGPLSFLYDFNNNNNNKKH